MFIIFTQNETIVIAFFIEGGNTNALKIKLAACSPTAMMSHGGRGHGKLQWVSNSRGKFNLEHRRTSKTTLSKVVWQIILPSAKRKSNPYK